VNWTRIGLALAVVLAITALGVGAPALRALDPVDPGSGDGSGTGTGNGTGAPRQTPDANATLPTAGGGLPPFAYRVMAVLVVVALIGSAYVVVTQYDRYDLAFFLVTVLAIVAVALVFTALDLDPGSVGEGATRPPPPTPGGSGAAESGAVQTADPTRVDLPVSALALAGVVGMVVLGALGTLYRYSGTDETAATSEASAASADRQQIRAVGDAAGQAADDLANDTAAGFENAIYRAWREMTDALAVDRPETTTPEEFADAAIAAGLAEEDVRELTTLFERVRYGDEPVSAEREQRAEDALRRIEETYAEDDP
jgi:hypothetical protein